MTPEEAISILKSWRITGDKSHEAVDMAIEALEKQMPKKTLAPELGISPRHPIIIPCGNCGMELADRMWGYCPWCGQAISWEGE